MEVVTQIKLMHGLGHGIKAIARELGLSKNTVKNYLQKDIPGGPKALSDKLEKLFEFYPYCKTELARKGVTRQILWGEYRAKHPQGYSYTQFCEYYNQWLHNNDASLHIEQVAGDKMYIDYTGTKLSIVSYLTGEITELEVFVSVLGFSGLTYVRACHSQQKADFLQSIALALDYYGCVPKVIVPDNLKSAIDKANNYEADINRDLLDLGNHYGVAVLSARSRKPRDKAWVERMVQIIYTRVFAPLRNRVFHNIDTLNEAILELLNQHNNHPLQQRQESRRELFETQEKEHMLPLPEERYELKEYLYVTVMKNSHVQLHKDRHYYSVPHQHIGKKVKLVYTVSSISIYFEGQRIAYHLRDRKQFKYTTVKEHLPSTHQFVSEWNPTKFLTWAQHIHPDVHAYISRVLENKSYPEQTYRSCVGILSFDKKAGRERLIAACQRASGYGVYNYKVIEQIISNKLDRLDTPQEIATMPEHDNVRGANYFK